MKYSTGLYFLLLSLHSVIAQEKTQAAIAIADILPRLGFRILKKGMDREPTPWERDKFGLVAKDYLFIKSKFPSGFGEDWFYRFTITKEDFADSTHARFRLDSLFVKPPKLNVSDDYVFNLRDGFQSGNVVVIVQTDVSGYTSKMKQLTQCLRRIGQARSSAKQGTVIDSASKVLRKPME